MQTHPTTSSRKGAKTLAQIAYVKGIDALKASGGLTETDQRFLFSQRPSGVDEEGRIVLDFATPAAAAAARSNPLLNRIARQLREGRLASGLDRRVAAPSRPQTNGTPRRSEPPKQKVLYLPAFLTAVTLPHSKVAGSEFSRVNGDIRLSLVAPSRPGLPYGLYPRLILMHLTTKALLHRERTFYVGESANSFLALMGIANNGGVNGASTRAREQLRRLCLTSFSYHDRSKDRGRNIALADKWVTWPGRGVQVTLGERFYTIARSGSVPLDASILTGLGRSPLALDAYAWLTSRVARLDRETVVPWRSLEVQFGAEYKHPRQFRWKFRRALEGIKELWIGIDAEPREKGLLIRPCAPSVLSWLERSAARGSTPLEAHAHKR